MTWIILVLWQFSTIEFKESQSWISVRQLLIVVMSEDGSVIFNYICISSAYEWYVICGYLSKIWKKWLDVDIKQKWVRTLRDFINFILSVGNDIILSWSVSLLPIYVSLVAKMLWLIVSKVAERSIWIWKVYMIMEPYLDESVLYNLSSMCVIAVSVLLKDVYAFWKIFNMLYLRRYDLSSSLCCFIIGVHHVMCEIFI